MHCGLREANFTVDGDLLSAEIEKNGGNIVTSKIKIQNYIKIINIFDNIN